LALSFLFCSLPSAGAAPGRRRLTDSVLSPGVLLSRAGRGPRGVVPPRLRAERGGDVPRGRCPVHRRPQRRLGRARAHHEGPAAPQLGADRRAAGHPMLRVQRRAERERDGHVAARARGGRQRATLLVARRQRGQRGAEALEGSARRARGVVGVVVVVGGHRSGSETRCGALLGDSPQCAAEIDACDARPLCQSLVPATQLPPSQRKNCRDRSWI